MSLPKCEDEIDSYRTEFQNCLTANKNPYVKGDALVDHCCEMVTCRDPQLVDPRCRPAPPGPPEPHFGDMRPMTYNSKYSHKGVGVL